MTNKEILAKIESKILKKIFSREKNKTLFYDSSIKMDDVVYKVYADCIETDARESFISNNTKNRYKIWYNDYCLEYDSISDFFEKAKKLDDFITKALQIWQEKHDQILAIETEETKKVADYFLEPSELME